MKYLWLLLIVSLPAQALQPIPYDQVVRVFTNIEPRFTSNPNDGKSYIWGKFIGTVPSAWGTPMQQRYCFLAPLNADLEPVVTAISITGQGTALRMVWAASTGKWFWTNAVGIEQDQAGLDWCTQ